MSSSSSSNQMKLIQIESPGGPDVLRLSEGPRPVPKSDEVLIQVAAAGVNRPDILQRKGAYPPPPGASPILGLEVAGTIVQCGSQCKIWKVGDPICALVTGGGYAEYCTAPEVQCLPIPKGLSFEEAAGIPETYFTVWANVFVRGKLQPNESILIHGGASGIGTTAIQLAHSFGAKVFVTAGTAEKCLACRKLGADEALNYNTEDFASELFRFTSGKGVDVILDMVGGDYFSKNLEILAREGRLVQIAFQKGESVQLSLRTLMSKGLTLTGSTLRARSAEEKGKLAAQLHENVWPLLEKGIVKVIMDRVYPLEQATEAHRRMESNKHIGKIVLKI